MKIRNKHAALNLYSRDYGDIYFLDAFAELDVPVIFQPSAQVYIDQDLVELVVATVPDNTVEGDKPSLKAVVFEMLDDMDKVNFTPEGNLKLVAVRKKFGGEVTREELDAVIDEYNALYPERTV